MSNPKSTASIAVSFLRPTDYWWRRESPSEFYEAYYVKVLAADAEILRPQAESMTPRTKALYDFLFAA